MPTAAFSLPIMQAVAKAMLENRIMVRKEITKLFFFFILIEIYINYACTNNLFF